MEHINPPTHPSHDLLRNTYIILVYSNAHIFLTYSDSHILLISSISPTLSTYWGCCQVCDPLERIIAICRKKDVMVWHHTTFQLMQVRVQRGVQTVQMGYHIHTNMTCSYQTLPKTAPTLRCRALP